MHTRILPVIATVLLATACTTSDVQSLTSQSETVSSVESSLASSSTSLVPTRNVSFVGVLSLASPHSVEGTHVLTLSDSSTILLRSSDGNLDLSTYAGKKVEVRGSVQPSADANGTTMSVEEVTVLEIASSSSSQDTSRCGGYAGIACPSGFTCVDDLTDDCDPIAGGADCTGICTQLASSATTVSSVSSSSTTSTPTNTSSRSSSSASSLSTLRSSQKMSSVSSVMSSSAVSEATTSSKSNAELVAMSKQNYSAGSLWTQRYCTSHIAFCISVHKNWYFKSFGATTNALWHVEFAMSDIYDINQGIIVLNLVSGPSSTTGGVSGSTKRVGSDVVGYLDWKGDHFEISGDASLQGAISYMLSSIQPYTPGE